MYPINAASPERIAIGAVVQISDGAVQTSGVTVSVTKQGGAETGSAGTIAFSAGGIVFYTPTQGETNATSFIVTAYKTGCIPVAVTVVTTASGVPGYAGIDWSKINAPTTTVNLSGTTIGVMTTNSDKTGYALSATGSAALTEGYPAKGGTGTLPQLLYNILQHLEESSISSTTKTINKRDQATAAGTFTLDSATAPNSITRAT